MKQSQPLRIESNKFYSFATCKTVNSSLWFVNNPKLEENILAYLAKYQEKYSVTLYSFVIQGNHYHLLAKFNQPNRAQFFRDFNARIAELVKKYVRSFGEGPVFQRRYSEQAIPLESDLEDRFFYCALQPVQAGLCKKISEYPGYNSCFDAIQGKVREFTLTNWSEYNSLKRYSKKIDISDFQETYSLKFDKLPNRDKLCNKQYRSELFKKLEKERLTIVANTESFMGKNKLLKVKPGSKPKTTKRSTRGSKRPLVLTKCLKTKQVFLDWYFGVYATFKEASKRYLKGDLEVSFPPNTYKPPLILVSA